MPPKKSNLNNQRSRHARRARAQRHTTSTNQTMAANATERFASGEMDTREVSLRWNDHHITMISVFEKLLENSSLVDCTIAAEGQYLKAHKVVLSACSPYFELLFSQENEKNPIVVLKDVKFQELKDIIDFIYRGKVKVPEHRLGVFVEVAESLQIKGLASEPKKHLQNSDERSKDSPGTHRKTHCSSSITSKRRRNNDIGVIEGNKSDLVQMSDANDNRNNSHRNVHSPSLLQQALLTASSSSQPEITSPFNADEFTPSEETEDLLKADTPFAPLFQAPETPTKSLQQTVSSAVKTELEPIAQIFLPETENVDDPSNGIFIEESTVMTEKEDIGEPVSKPDDQSASQYSGRRRRRPSAWAAAQSGWGAPAQTAAPVWTPPPPASLKTKQQQQQQQQPQQQAAGAPAAGGRRRGRASAADRTCPVCGRVMAVPSQLTRHLRVHTGERPYRCKMCGQSFTQSSSLRVHQRLHTGERPFGCGLCDRRFYRASNLRAHMRSHTGERPYACDVCGRRFAHGGERLRHERLAHGAPPPTPRLRRAALHPAAPAPEDDPPALDADASPGGAGEDGESDVAFALW